MVVLGVLTHFLKKLVNLKKSGKGVAPLQYWKLYPYQTSLTLVATAVGYFFLLEADQLTICWRRRSPQDGRRPGTPV